MFQSRKFYYTLFVLGSLYVLLVQQFFQNESRFIISSPKYTNETPYVFKSDFQELNLKINKEIVLHGVWFKQQNPKGLILFFPDSDIDFRLLDIHKNLYYQNGYDVLFSAYRGTAKSKGKLTNEDDLFSDAQNWYNFAKSQFSSDDIILAGDRFGATIAAQLAGKNSIKTTILENPYYSYSKYKSRTKFWWLPYSYFTSFKLNTTVYVRRIASEIILILDQEKKNQDDCLTHFLKSSDKTFWLKNDQDIPFSFQADKAELFTKIMHRLQEEKKSSNQ